MRFIVRDIIDVRPPRALNELCGNLRCKLERDFSRSSTGERFIDIISDLFFSPLDVTWRFFSELY